MSDKKTKTLHFRVTEKEEKALFKLLKQLNKGKPKDVHINRNQLLQCAVRNLVDMGPEFLKPELDTLEETNRYLLGIGRNVNQVVKRINSGETTANEMTEKYLKTIVGYITQSRKQIDALVTRNYKRAQTPYTGELGHGRE